MALRVGMDEKLGHVAYERERPSMFAGHDTRGGHGREFSESRLSEYRPTTGEPTDHNETMDHQHCERQRTQHDCDLMEPARFHRCLFLEGDNAIRNIRHESVPRDSGRSLIQRRNSNQPSDLQGRAREHCRFRHRAIRLPCHRYHRCNHMGRSLFQTSRSRRGRCTARRVQAPPIRSRRYMAAG